jgi:hypothetical protein
MLDSLPDRHNTIFDVIPRLRVHVMRIWGIIILLALAAVSSASAHSLGFECKLRDDRLELEAYFSDDTPARRAAVTVRDSSDQIVCEGQTDREGKWSCPLPAPGRYEVVVDAGDGHRKQELVTVPKRGTTAPSPAVSEGPSREEFTRTPWLRLAVGLVIIAIGSAALLAILRLKRFQKPNAGAVP